MIYLPFNKLLMKKSVMHKALKLLVNSLFIVSFIQSGYGNSSPSVNVTSPSGKALFSTHCASCHGVERTGLMGPALLPGNLSRLRKKSAIDVITHGRTATQMPGFSDKLSIQAITEITNFIYQPPKIMPEWKEDDIANSRKDLRTSDKISKKPLFDANLWNLFVVVESGDHHITLLDGDKFEPITRFKSHYALHGGPKFTRDGRYVYFGSRDGWVSKYDIFNMSYVAEVRAGINMRNIAVSDDGQYVVAANYWPHNVVVLDGEDLSLIKTIPAASIGGKSSRISAVYHARPRNSFVVALKDIAEIWEIPYIKKPNKNHWVHDYREDSGDNALPLGKFHLEPIKMKTENIFDDFFFSPDYQRVIGATRPLDSGKTGKIAKGQVFDLDKKQKISDLELAGMPHLGSGISWMYQGERVLATPNLRDNEISVINMENWKTIKRIKTEGPGFFMRSHENSDYAWSDVFFGPNKDKVHIIDKKTLEIVKTLRPEPGKTAAHIEFTKDGRYALMSLMELNGALIIYDSKTLKEIKRIPMKRPVGKYNVYNKTHLSTGTSH